MKERLLDLLACPTCGGDILLAYASKFDDKEIIEGVLTCKKCTREYKVERGLPRFADLAKFDDSFSVGVLHHTPDPKRAFISLASKVKKGGHISAWVYGAENNEWITRFVDPVRTSFTSQISQPVLYQLSKLPTLGVFLTTKLVYRPLNIAAAPVANKLFYNEYLNHLGTFGWREHHNIVFDHLVAPTAFYISKDDFTAWWNEIGANDVEITWHNENSW